MKKRIVELLKKKKIASGLTAVVLAVAVVVTVVVDAVVTTFTFDFFVYFSVILFITVV